MNDKGCLSNMCGVCLAELAIGMATAVFVIAGLLEMLHFVGSVAGAKRGTMAQRQDIRLGLEVFEQEVRQATADSIISATQDTVSFFANIHAQHTNITATVMPGQSILPVLDGSSWGEGKSVALCGRLLCEMHRLSRAGQQYQLTLAEPVGATFPAGAFVEIRNRVVYYTKEDEEGRLRLMRMVDGGANTLIGELETVMFSYRDKRGRVTSTPSEVTHVIVEIEPKYTSRRETVGVAFRS